ncbi:Mariner Mos1 transposase [Eumeta japonica]|uniref:Mariner Mos1 transposase n=1 Tax=Eumeta variegata TaxID=151549 RepID=A0A4C1WZ11_EUMVA|nr:Mariner Mos1 transposase [Eumeta japonica]
MNDFQGLMMQPEGSNNGAGSLEAPSSDPESQSWAKYISGTLFKRNLQLKHIELLLRLMATMLCQIRYAETGFDASKIMDFELEDKECSGAPKKFEDEKLEELLNQNRCQTLTELGKTLQVDESTVSKCLEVLGMIQKQGYWIPYELKLRDFERRFLPCELLLQW